VISVYNKVGFCVRDAEHWILKQKRCNTYSTNYT